MVDRWDDTTDFVSRVETVGKESKVVDGGDDFVKFVITHLYWCGKLFLVDYHLLSTGTW